jgi:hypothetical protein
MQVSDRILMGISLVACAIGCLCMISWTGGSIVLAMYIISFTLILAFTNILEGVSMSVLSKVIHPSLAKGTFNAGVHLAVTFACSVPSHCDRQCRGLQATAGLCSRPLYAC